MDLIREIKKNVKFYENDMRKWEIRIFITSILLFLGLIGITLFHFSLIGWEINISNFTLFDYLKYTILMPIVFYLNFSVVQFNSFKKEMNLHKLKLIELQTLASQLEPKKSYN
tara:strand:- start:3619 stop:3957 length:339 start_codon:yes stop_codon:yes gene_type:complete